MSSKFEQQMVAAFEDELVKIASEIAVPKGGSGKAKAFGLLATGAAGYGIARQANEDRKLGKAVRKQQMG